MPAFIWKCPNCQTVNDNRNWLDKDGISTCKQCGKPTIDLSEALCIHGYAVDMACDECPRSGFRFEGVNTSEEVFLSPKDWEEIRNLGHHTSLPQDLIEDQLADEGSLDGPGFRCERMKGKTTGEEEWKDQHYFHGIPQKVYNEAQPSSYRLYKLICLCGASLQCMEELEGVD